MLAIGRVGQNRQDVFLRELREIFKHRLLLPHRLRPHMSAGRRKWPAGRFSPSQTTPIEPPVLRDTGAAGADVVSRTEAQQRLAGLRTGAGSGTGTAPLRLAEAKKRRHGPR